MVVFPPPDSSEVTQCLGSLVTGRGRGESSFYSGTYFTIFRIILIDEGTLYILYLLWTPFLFITIAIAYHRIRHDSRVKRTRSTHSNHRIAMAFYTLTRRCPS